MYKITKSLITILAVAAIAAGATSAYFSSSDVVAGNSFATGTLHVKINEGVNKPMHAVNMKPGDEITGWFDAYNDGTLDAEYYFYINAVSGNATIRDNLMIELRDGGYTGAGDGPIIYSGKLINLNGAANMIKTSDDNVHAASTPGGDNIRAGWTQRIYQRIWLPIEVGNAAMSNQLTWNEVVYATQDMDPDSTAN